MVVYIHALSLHTYIGMYIVSKAGVFDTGPNLKRQMRIIPNGENCFPSKCFYSEFPTCLPRSGFDSGNKKSKFHF
jgi:hypothetical protein